MNKHDPICCNVRISGRCDHFDQGRRIGKHNDQHWKRKLFWLNRIKKYYEQENLHHYFIMHY